MADTVDNPDRFIRRPDRPSTPEQETRFERFVQMTVNRLRNATNEDINRTIQVITSKAGFTKRVGGRLAVTFEKEVRNRLERERH